MERKPAACPLPLSNRLGEQLFAMLDVHGTPRGVLDLPIGVVYRTFASAVPARFLANVYVRARVSNIEKKGAHGQKKHEIKPIQQPRVSPVAHLGRSHID